MKVIKYLVFGLDKWENSGGMSDCKKICYSDEEKDAAVEELKKDDSNHEIEVFNVVTSEITSFYKERFKDKWFDGGVRKYEK